MVLWVFEGNMVGKWTNEPCNGADEEVNPFWVLTLTRRMIGGKYNKWIVVLQEFDLEFVSAKSKKSLIFAELISDFLSEAEELYVKIRLSMNTSS